MTSPTDRPPPWIHRLLGRLLRGSRGVEALRDLDRAYGVVRARHSRAVARAWYLLQLVRPDTWRLARALRRIGKAEWAEATPGLLRVNRLRRVTELPLDLKLAWRMLVRSPGLTVVGVLGVALGTGVGVGFFVALSALFFPRLPLAEGDRVVALANWNVDANRLAPLSLRDFATWRDGLGAVEQIAAASIGPRTLVTGNSAPQSVRAAEVTAAAFEVARVPPLLGRYLLEDDEREGAQRVAVIGYDLWRTRFDGGPVAVGRRILVGGSEHTVVGVMPPGFSFPKNEELWTALRGGPPRADSTVGRDLFVFGRLASGATREQAQAELTSLSRTTVGSGSGRGAHTRPRIVPYTYPLDNIGDVSLWQAAEIQLMVTLLLVAIAVNVAVLVYARTCMRQAEIAVRTALGAGRGRIVSQLFTEALLLSGVGAGLGLLAAHLVLRQVQALDALLGEGSGFWIDFGLRPRSVAVAVALAVLSAVVIGVVPGLKATGRGSGTDVRRIGTGASAPLGRAWTAMIIAQVVVAVAVLPTALGIGFRELRFASRRSTFPAHEFLSAQLGIAIQLRPGMDGDGYRRETAARFADRVPVLVRRLEGEPAVAGVTFEGNLPGRGMVEVEGASGAGDSRGLVLWPATGVATDYFDVVGTRILAGRGLGGSDIGASGIGVVVSEAFAKRSLGGRDALGRRLRFVTAPDADADAEAVVRGPWLEVAGVVADLYASALDPDLAPPIAYYAVSPGELPAVNLLIRVRGGDALSFAPRLRDIAHAVDPDFRIGALRNLSTLWNPGYLAMVAGVIVITLATVVFLSVAGIHALMSLAVTRRRREIGIRTALGAHPGRLLLSVFSRAAWQLGLGGLIGAVVGGVLILWSGQSERRAALFLGGVVALMLTAGLVAAVGPARRGLRIEPMDALREE